MKPGPGDTIVPEALWLDGKRGRLAGVFYRDDSDPRGVLLIAPPFGEERKCSHRSMHRTAQSLAQAGYFCLRLDLWGVGDSQGAFQEGDVETWVEDLCAGMDWLAERHPGMRPGALGLRLGGSLCVRALRARPMGPCVLWEPVISGPAFLADSLKRKRIKRMMTEGKGAGAEDEVQEALSCGQVVDFDGYAVSPEMYRQLEGLDLAGETPPRETELLWVQMGPSQTMGKGLQDLAERWREDSVAMETLAVREKPFWNLIGALHAPEALQPTLHWLEGREDKLWKST